MVAGRLDAVGPVVQFTYGRSYLAREDAIAIYEPELALVDAPISPRGRVAGCIEDAAPDAWGQRVILNSRVGQGALDTADLGILTYLLESGSDRIGALDFQASASSYVARAAGRRHARRAGTVSRARSRTASRCRRRWISRCCTEPRSAGHGQRPCSATATRRLIAKFSSATDPYPVVKAEFVAMELARRAGLRVAHVELARALGKDVLLDRPLRPRPATGRGARWCRP